MPRQFLPIPNLPPHGILSHQPLAYGEPLLEQPLRAALHVYRRICPAGGHHPKGGPSLRTARAAARSPGNAASIASTGPRIWSGSAFIREAQRLGCKLGELVPLLAGVTSLDHFPGRRWSNWWRTSWRRSEAEVARLQRQHQGLSQCATLLAQHPTAMAPRSGTPDAQDHPATADRGQRWLDSVPWDKGCNGAHCKEPYHDPQPACSQQQPRPTASATPSPGSTPAAPSKGRPRHPASRGRARLRSRTFTTAAGRGAAPEPDLQAVQQSLAQAQHLVIVAPSGGATCLPGSRGCWIAPLPGFAFRCQPGKAHPERLLAGKTARLLLTMDSPWYYRWWQGAPVERTPGPAGAGAVRHSADPPPASGARPHSDEGGPPALAHSNQGRRPARMCGGWAGAPPNPATGIFLPIKSPPWRQC